MASSTANQCLPAFLLTNREIESGRVALDLHAPPFYLKPHPRNTPPTALHSTYTTTYTLETS